jgi:hypothetical protein
MSLESKFASTDNADTGDNGETNEQTEHQLDTLQAGTITTPGQQLQFATEAEKERFAHDQIRQLQEHELKYERGAQPEKQRTNAHNRMSTLFQPSSKNFN